MQIFVKTISSRTIALEVDLDDSFLDVKQKIHMKDAIPTEKMRLIYRGKQMDDDATLRKHHVEKHSTITCCIRGPTHQLYELGEILELRAAANLLWRPKLLPEAISRCRAVVTKIADTTIPDRGGCGPACLSELLKFVDHLKQKIDGAGSAGLSASAYLSIPLLCGAIIKIPFTSTLADPAGADSERSHRCSKEQRVVLVFTCLQLLVSLQWTVQAGDGAGGHDGRATRGVGHPLGYRLGHALEPTE